VLSQPIKGTRLAGRPLLANDRALRTSAKEDAELSMIVDLIRNDISPHCQYGTVGVEGHKSVFEVDGLLQMYSNVTGRLKPGSTALDLLWAALPPGSVTGCPKKRAIEIIAGLEPHHREAYCGCLVVVHGPEDLDSSVAIRTAVVDEARSRFSFHAGSGIVVDSDPDKEYEETLAKAAKFLALDRRKRL
jgi:para-aminobenzoate synthetase component 1